MVASHAILRIPATFILFLLLAACDRQSDAQRQKLLSGTWTNSNEHIQSTTTVEPAGTYDCQLVVHGSNDSTRTYSLSGAFKVHNGMLIETITKHSQSNAPVPIIFTSSIVRLDSHELIYKYLDGAGRTNDAIILRKK